MKTFFYTTALTLLIPVSLFSQNVVNWRSMKETHVVQASTGLENGYVIGLGYGYKLPTKRNILVSTDYSFPTGNHLFDDFKIRLGGQSEIVSWKNWTMTIKAYSVFRRYENTLAILSGFGSEFSMVAGYARPRWQLMGEFGFDKAIVTRIKNSEAMKNIYPDVKDGWYIPTGGNFFYGFQTGFSFGWQDIFLKAGKIISQDFETAPFLPLYLKVGLNCRF